MTPKQIADNAYYKSAKCQTFYRGDEFYSLVAWIMEQVETVDVGATGCQLTRKYCLSVKTMSDDRKNYKQKALKFK